MHWLLKKMIWPQNCFLFTPKIMKLHTQTLHELRKCSIDFGVQRSRSVHWFLKMIYNYNLYCKIPLPFQLSAWNFTSRILTSWGCAQLILRSKGQGHNAFIGNWRWLILHNSFVFSPIIMKLHIKTPYGLRMCPMDFEVKTSRSRCITEIFFLHNCFPFTPIIVKLHTQSPIELKMCPIDFRVKRSKVKVTIHWLLKMVFGA